MPWLHGIIATIQARKDRYCVDLPDVKTVLCWTQVVDRGVTKKTNRELNAKSFMCSFLVPYRLHSFQFYLQDTLPGFFVASTCIQHHRDKEKRPLNRGGLKFA